MSTGKILNYDERRLLDKLSHRTKVIFSKKINLDFRPNTFPI